MNNLFKIFLIVIGFVSFSSFGDIKETIMNLDSEVRVEFPVSFGVHGKVHVNQSMYFRVGLGSSNELQLNNMYSTSNLTSVKQDKAGLLRDSLQNSLYSDIRVGFRMNRTKGFYGEVGYSLMSLGKGETSSEHLSQSIGRTGLNGRESYEVHSTVHNATVHAGYLFPIFKKVALSAELGLIKPVSSVIEMDYKDSFSSATEQKDSQKVAQILQEIFLVTGSLWVSYIF